MKIAGFAAGALLIAAGASAQDDEEGYRDVQGIRAGIVAIGVGVPHREMRAAEMVAPFVEAARLLTQPIDMLVLTEPLPDPDHGARIGDAPLEIVLVQRRSLVIGEGDPERVVTHGDGQGRCPDDAARPGDLEDRSVFDGALPHHSVGVIPAERLARRELRTSVTVPCSSMSMVAFETGMSAASQPATRRS